MSKKTLDDIIVGKPESPVEEKPDLPAPIFTPESGYSTPNSPEETLARVRACKAQVDRNYLQMGCDLWRIKTKKWYISGGGEIYTWRDYLDSINEDPKRAQRLIRVWTCLVREVGIPAKQLFGIGYSKASLLASLVNGKAGKILTNANADHWTSLARDYGYSTVESEVKMAKQDALGIETAVIITDGSQPSGDGEAGPASSGLDDPTAAPEDGVGKPSPTVTVESPPEKMTFMLFPEQARDVEEALIHVGIEGNSDKRGHQLHLMSLAVMAQNMGEKAPGDGRPRYFLNIFEKSFGGRVVWVKDDIQAKKIANEHPDLFKETDGDDEHDDGND